MNHKINKAFLAKIDSETRDLILAAIAQEFGTTADFAYHAVTDEEAEHLLDYLTGSVRGAVSVTMRRHGFAV
jgi:hypothetical protein